MHSVAFSPRFSPAARAQHVARKRDGIFDDEDVDGAQKRGGFVRIFRGEPERQASREAYCDEFLHGRLPFRSSILKRAPGRGSRTVSEPF